MADEAQTHGYFDIDIDGDKLASHMVLDEVFYLKDLKQRKIVISDDIDDEAVPVQDAIHNILQFNADDRMLPPEARKPILLYLTSNGGSVDVGMQLIDIILNSKTPVYTINTGRQYSMGFLIGLAGHKRFATKNAKFLMHDGTTFVVDSTSKAKDQMEFQIKIDERIKQYVLSRSKLTAEEYDKKYTKEWYMFADEAKENGFIDFIVGIDCDIDAIV